MSSRKLSFASARRVFSNSLGGGEPSKKGKPENANEKEPNANGNASGNAGNNSSSSSSSMKPSKEGGRKVKETIKEEASSVVEGGSASGTGSGSGTLKKSALKTTATSKRGNGRRTGNGKGSEREQGDSSQEQSKGRQKASEVGNDGSSSAHSGGVSWKKGTGNKQRDESKKSKGVTLNLGNGHVPSNSKEDSSEDMHTDDDDEDERPLNAASSRSNGSTASVGSSSSVPWAEGQKSLKKTSSKAASEVGIEDGGKDNERGRSDRRGRSFIAGARSLTRGRTDTMGSDGEARSLPPRPEKSKHSRSRSRYVSTGKSLFKLSDAESSFLPNELRRRLGAQAGQLPPAPSVFVSSGAVLFVDISGFTKLGERLGKDNVPVLAAKKLAKEITNVLAELTRVCLDFGGDIAKFAGDALLCVWDTQSVDVDFNTAKACGIEMLHALRELNKEHDAGGLQIHGGIARGSILHFHLGSGDEDHRWYMVAGEAVAGATALVDTALPGEMACLNEAAKGRPEVEERSEAQRREAREKIMTANRKNVQEKRKSRSANALKPTPEELTQAEEEEDNGQDMRDMLKRRLEMDEKARLKTANSVGRSFRGSNLAVAMKGSGKNTASYLTADTTPPKLQKRRQRVESADPLLRDGLPRSCNVYMPRSLRGANIEAKIEQGGYMRQKVAILFADIEEITLEEDELIRREVPDQKVDALNSAFVDMTRITQTFGGEVRDMLFDDKGCVYIAVFGAHDEEENLDSKLSLKAMYAAMAIAKEVPSAKIGVSAGTCFVGMCGVDERHDFVVIGNDVNMAARLMVKAGPGEVLVSSGIHGSAKDAAKKELSFTEKPVQIGKGQKLQTKTVYSPQREMSSRPSFLAQYQYALRDRANFVGRNSELGMLEATLTKICFQSGRSGIILVQAQAGMGKSALANRARRMGKGRIKIATGTSTPSTRYKKLFAFRALLEAYTGLRPALTEDEMSDVLSSLAAASSSNSRLDESALAEILPWLSDLARKNNGKRHDKDKMTMERIADAFIKVIDLGRARDRVEASLLILEDMHEMDVASIELLSVILDKLPKINRLCVMITCRPISEITEELDAFDESIAVAGREDKDSEEEKRKDLITATLSKARKIKFNSLHLELQGLSKGDSNTLVARTLGGQGLEPSALERVYQETQGIPMHLTQLVQWIKSKGYLRQQNGRDVFAWTDEGKNAPFPSGGEKGVIIARLKMLERRVQHVLELAAVGGVDFDTAFVLTASKLEVSKLRSREEQLTEDSILKHLRLALECAFVSHLGEKGQRDEQYHRWRFVHDTIRRAVLASMDNEKKKQLAELLKVERQKLSLRMGATFYEEEGEE